ncbi:Arm DNA-binding domain-containing protein [Xanthobacter oligotrophicus]|uniref:Arm DNA-binding domain-containing protein n=1 Tax=Xanthobacter oligotrophicus TaxID=2607286 RepID=UPI00372D620E
MPLSDIAVRNAKGRDKTFKLSDGGGLFLQVNPDGGRLWRMAYRFDKKQKLSPRASYCRSCQRSPCPATLSHPVADISSRGGRQHSLTRPEEFLLAVALHRRRRYL